MSRETKVTASYLIPVNDAYLRGIDRNMMDELEEMPYIEQIQTMATLDATQTCKPKIMVIKPIPTKTDLGYEPTMLDMRDTPSDRRLGTDVPESSCPTCKKDYYYCGGHEGFIPLPFSYVQYEHRKTLLMILNSFCTDVKCAGYGMLRITTPSDGSGYSDKQIDDLEEIKRNKIEQSRSRIPYIFLDSVSKMKSQCGCVGKAGNWKITATESNKMSQDIQFTYKGRVVDPSLIKTYLRDIDAIPYNHEFFGINGWLFADLVLSTIHVLPLSKRPDEYDSVTMTTSRNMITNLYNRILLSLTPMIRRTSNIYNRKEIMDALFSAVHLVSEQKTTKKNIETTIRGFPGSKGLRVTVFTSRQQEASARSPISGKNPEKYYDDERDVYRISGLESVGVPYVIATDMHLNVVVNENNIDKVNSWLRKGLIDKYTPLGGVEMNVTPITVKLVRMEIGYIVRRRMLEGDEALYKRHPILSKASIGHGKVKIVKNKTMEISLPVTQRFNADFDGDEMNLSKPGSRAAKAEMINYSVIEDVIPAASSHASYGIDYVNKYTIKEINKVKILDPSIFLEAWDISQPVNRRTYFDRLNRLTGESTSEEDFIINGATPNQVFSVLFPSTFNYRNGNLRIIDGIITAGSIDTDHITSNSTSIQVALYKQFNYIPAYIFINSIDYILLVWMSRFGFTIGPSDLFPSDPIKSEIFKRGKAEMITKVEQNLREIENYYDITDNFIPSDKSDYDSFKRSIDSATRISGTVSGLVDETFSDNNVLRNMMDWKISGNRGVLHQILMPIGKTRSIDYEDTDKHSKATNMLNRIKFISESYTEGISPDLIYEPIEEGRAKAITKQIKVSEGGTFNYKMTSALSPFFVTDDGFVMSVHGDVMSDVYGTEGISDRKVSLVKNGNDTIYDLMDNELLADVMEAKDEPPRIPDHLIELNRRIGGLLYYYGGLIMYGVIRDRLLREIHALADIYDAEIVEFYIDRRDQYGDIPSTEDEAAISAYNEMIVLSERGVNYKTYNTSAL